MDADAKLLKITEREQKLLTSESSLLQELSKAIRKKMLKLD